MFSFLPISTRCLILYNRYRNGLRRQNNIATAWKTRERLLKLNVTSHLYNLRSKSGRNGMFIIFLTYSARLSLNSDGATVEDMTVEVNKRKAALDNAKKELKNMVALNRALKRSIKVRLRKWHEFRRHIALRCKIYFGYHLSQRGYYGKVLFDHVTGQLQLKVSLGRVVARTER